MLPWKSQIERNKIMDIAVWHRDLDSNYRVYEKISKKWTNIQENYQKDNSTYLMYMSSCVHSFQNDSFESYEHKIQQSQWTLSFLHIYPENNPIIIKILSLLKLIKKHLLTRYCTQTISRLSNFSEDEFQNDGVIQTRG